MPFSLRAGACSCWYVMACVVVVHVRADIPYPCRSVPISPTHAVGCVARPRSDPPNTQIEGDGPSYPCPMRLTRRAHEQRPGEPGTRSQITHHTGVGQNRVDRRSKGSGSVSLGRHLRRPAYQSTRCRRKAPGGRQPGAIIRGLTVVPACDPGLYMRRVKEFRAEISKFSPEFLHSAKSCHTGGFSAGLRSSAHLEPRLPRVEAPVVVLLERYGLARTLSEPRVVAVEVAVIAGHRVHRRLGFLGGLDPDVAVAG